MLANDVEAAREAAHRAEGLMEQLDEKERLQLLRFMIELERRYSICRGFGVQGSRQVRRDRRSYLAHAAETVPRFGKLCA